MARAASSTSRNVDSVLGALVGLTSTTTRTALGASSRKSPSRLATTSEAKKLKPVALPPGRARLATNLCPTGSPLKPNRLSPKVLAIPPHTMLKLPAHYVRRTTYGISHLAGRHPHPVRPQRLCAPPYLHRWTRVAQDRHR